MAEIITDPVEAGARALMKHKQLSWAGARETWREEQRDQARLVLASAKAAAEGGWSDPDDGAIASASCSIL